MQKKVKASRRSGGEKKLKREIIREQGMNSEIKEWMGYGGSPESAEQGIRTVDSDKIFRGARG